VPWFSNTGALARDRGDLRAHLLLPTSASVHTFPNGRAESWIQEAHRRPGQGDHFHPRRPPRHSNKLIEAEGFEKSSTSFNRHQALGLYGAESLIPALDRIIKRVAICAWKGIVVGMPHRAPQRADPVWPAAAARCFTIQGRSVNPDAVGARWRRQIPSRAPSSAASRRQPDQPVADANQSHLEIAIPGWPARCAAKQDPHGAPPYQRIFGLPSDAWRRPPSPPRRGGGMFCGLSDLRASQPLRLLGAFSSVNTRSASPPIRALALPRRTVPTSPR